jgi:hypothetical protein
MSPSKTLPAGVAAPNRKADTNPAITNVAVFCFACIEFNREPYDKGMEKNNFAAKTQRQEVK